MNQNTLPCAREKAPMAILCCTVYEVLYLTAQCIRVLFGAAAPRYPAIFIVIAGIWIFLSVALSLGIFRLHRGEEGALLIGVVCRHRRNVLPVAAVYYLILILRNAEGAPISAAVILKMTLPLVLIAVPYYIYMECVMKIMGYVHTEEIGQPCRIANGSLCPLLSLWFALISLAGGTLLIVQGIPDFSNVFDWVLLLLLLVEGIRFLLIAYCCRIFLQQHK